MTKCDSSIKHLSGHLGKSTHENGLVGDVQVPEGPVALQDFEGEPRVRRDCVVVKVKLE
jgi:hypothetical protein